MTTEGVDEKLIELLKEVGPYVSEDDTEWCRDNGVRIWRVTDKPIEEYVSSGGKIASFAWVNGEELNIGSGLRDRLIAEGKELYEGLVSAKNAVGYGFYSAYGKISRSSLAEGFGG